MLLFAEEEESDDGNMSLLLLLLMSTAPPEVMTGSCFHWSPNAEGYSDLGRFFGSFPPSAIYTGSKPAAKVVF